MSIENGPQGFNHSKEDYIWSLETVMPQLKALTQKPKESITQEELESLMEGVSRVELYKAALIHQRLEDLRDTLFRPELNKDNESFEFTMEQLRFGIAMSEDDLEKIVEAEKKEGGTG